MTTPSDALGHSPIAQLCFVTDNLEASVTGFARLTGLEPGAFAIAAKPDTSTAYHGEPSPVRARTCAFKLPNIDVEFLEPGPEPSVWRDTLNARGPSLHHIAFRADDLVGSQSAIEATGLACAQQADFVGGGGKYAVFDTSQIIGAMIELFEISR